MALPKRRLSLDEMEALFLQGKSLREIAKAAAISHERVRQLLASRGLYYERRPPRAMQPDARLEDTIGGRIAMVRRALGNDLYPMSQPAFAALLSRVRHHRYEYTRVSRLERNMAYPLAVEIGDIAAVDPLRRGTDWLIHGREPAPYVQPVRVTPPAAPERATPVTQPTPRARKKKDA